MEIITYIFIEFFILNGVPDIASRLVNVSNENGAMVIQQSEWDYLGKEPIPITIIVDEYGMREITFTTSDDSPRKFVSENTENLNYIEGEVFEGKKEVGTFILRKITGVTVDDPW